MRRFLGKLGVSLLLAVALVWVFTSAAMADTIGPITFETSQGYHLWGYQRSALPARYLAQRRLVEDWPTI